MKKLKSDLQDVAKGIKKLQAKVEKLVSAVEKEGKAAPKKKSAPKKKATPKKKVAKKKSAKKK